MRKWDLFLVGSEPVAASSCCWQRQEDLRAPLFPLQIHAYNLETNTWEEITTKPHEKVGELGIPLLSL